MKSTRLLHYWPWALLSLFGLATAALRFAVIQSRTITELCQSAQAPATCGVLHGIILGFVNGGYGYAALVATALTLVWRQPLMAWLTAACGLLALNLYCYEAGALAFLVGCLRLVRLQASRMPPAQPDGQRQRQAEAKP